MADGGYFTYERAGPTFLTQQPATVQKPKPPMAGWDIISNHLQNRMSMLQSWRLSWWQHWALLAQYMLPRRYHWLITPNTMARGLPINQQIVDPTGTQAMRICASGMMSGLSGPSRPWFKLKVRGLADLDRDSRLWLDAVEAKLYEIMAGSNFYDAMAQMYEDLTVFGTAPMIIYEDERDTIRCYNPCAGEYYLAASSSFRNDTLYRQFVLTIAQIVEMFGLENCPVEIQSLWATKDGNIDTERIVAHAIEPNFPLQARGRQGELKVLDGDFPYREVYWLYTSPDDRPLALRGFYECPFVTPRWATTSNDPYGRSVGMDVLPDIMQLQVQTRRKAEAIEKQVRPPLLASIELKNEPSSSLPGHVTYVSNLGPQNGMRPIYEVTPELNYMTADIAAIQERIKKGFFNDLFLMLQDVTKEMTAFEVAEKKQEKLQVLGPVIERMQNECLAPTIKRIYSIASAKKLFPPAPPGLQSVALQIEYISMLSLAQKAAATAGMERLIQITGAIGQTHPEVMDLVDNDEFVREYGDLLMVSQKVLRSPEQVAQMREERAQAQAQQQQASELAQGAQAAVDGAHTMSQTDVGGGVNALQMMLGQPGSGPPA